MVHKTNLVYNTCWEDPRLDRVALELGPEDIVTVITSAGCNALDYALCEPKRVHAVDMNPRQNALLELKMAGIRELSYEEFWQMMGEGRLRGFRAIYTSRLRKHLTPWAQRYWDRRTHFFDSRKSFYFRGSSGQVAGLINVYINRVAHIRPQINALLAAKTVEEQADIYNNQIKKKFWRGLIKRFVGSHTTLSMLGVPRQQRQQVELHYGRGIAEFAEDCIETVLSRLPLQDNYFWRVYIQGHYTPEACPEYLKPEGFARLKAGLVDRVSVHTNTVEGFLRSTSDRVTRFILLDHMDWLSTYRYEALISEWQAIVDRAAPQARVLFRSGGTKVEYVDPIPVKINGHERKVGELLTYKPELANELHQKCRVHTYGSFYIADLRTQTP